MADNQYLTQRIEYLRSIGYKISADREAHLQDRVAGGDTVEEVWSDTLKYIVGSQEDVTKAWILKQFGGEQIDDKRMNRLINDLVSGARSFHQMSTDITNATGNPPTTDPTTDPTGKDANNPNDIRIMGGEKRWLRATDGTYYVAYKLPGGSYVYFETTDQEMDAIFGAGNRPQATRFKNENTLPNNYYFGGGVAEITGEGNFQQEVNRAINRALQNGDLPDWVTQSMASTKEIMDLIYLSQQEDWTPDQLTSKISKTKAFQKRYAGIEHFYDEGLPVTQAVQAYRQYEEDLNAMYRRRGDNTTVTPGQIKKYLDNGNSVDDVKAVYGWFDQLETHAGAFRQFNDILRAKGQKPMTKADQIKFLQGNAPDELYKTWEQYQVYDLAKQAGLGNYISAQEAIQKALQTPGIETAATISQEMQQAASLILRYRHSVDTEKYGLSADDIINLSMGLPPAKGGLTQAELTNVLDKLSKEAQGFLQTQATPYVSFTDQGRPALPGLSGRATGL